MKDNVIIRFYPSVADYKETQSEQFIALVIHFVTNVLWIT